MPEPTHAGNVAPGPRGKILLGSLPEVQRKGFLQFYIDAWKEFGDLARIQMGPMVIHTIVRPEHVQHVLIKNVENYHKGLSHDKLRIALGNGVLTSEGPFWGRQRRLMAPTYSPRGVTRFAEIMTGVAQEVEERWKPGQPLAINQEMMILAMSVISNAVFGLDIREKFADAGKALGYILEYAAGRTMSLIDPPLFIPTRTNRQFKWALRTIDDFLYGVIAKRQSMPPGDDLLSLLMHARDEETGETMNEKQLRDEVLITFFAGHETTAQLLSWTFFMLDQHPEAEVCLHEELDAVLAGRTPTLEDVPKLVYTRQVIDEVLRLYSPVAVTARDVIHDDEIDGYTIPAGSMVMIAPYLTHRHPDFWETPLSFNPAHFTAEAAQSRPRYAYYPFGAGQRICLGMHFALLEAVLVLAELAQRYYLRMEPGQTVEPKFAGTLRPSADIRMVPDRRHAHQAKAV
jgi:cytochrome P450